MKLYPAVVTAHLLGGMVLLALLAAQSQEYVRAPLPMGRRRRQDLLAVFALVFLQIALGAWVSTNYAVLACTDFPTCQGSWWPPMDFRSGFTLQRELGQTAEGNWLPFEALTAIHQAHRLGAAVALAALVYLAWRLARASVELPACQRWARLIALLALWQLATGLSNIVLGWPLAAAVAHTGGAAALVACLTLLWVRARQALAAPHASSPARLDFGAAP